LNTHAAEAQTSILFGFNQEDFSGIEGGPATITVFKDGSNIDDFFINITPVTIEQFTIGGSNLPDQLITPVNDADPAESGENHSPIHHPRHIKTIHVNMWED
jgi:hypothetical protein